MRFGTYWACFEPLGQPPFTTAFTDRDGTVGIEFFEEWARASGWTLGPESLTPGLFDSLDDLHCDAFDAGAVHPLVRELYERTTAVSFVAHRPMWTPLGWLIHATYNRFIARRMRQLNAPLVAQWFPTEITSRIAPVRPAAHAPIRHRAWVRVYENARDHHSGIFYTAAVFRHETTGWSGTQRYLVAVLPLRFASMTVVFQPLNLPGGGFAIDTVQPGSYDAGTYLVVPGRRRYSMLPAGVRDQIRLHPRCDESGQYLEGAHRTWGAGIEGYTIPYVIRAKDQAAFGPPDPPSSGRDAPWSRRSKLPGQTAVVVAGAGPAGLAAALALSERGVPVLLVEATSELGGKCYTRRDDAGRAHGHGVHGWWPSYRNFDALLRAAGVDPDDALRPAREGGVVLERGTRRPLRNAFVLVPSPLHLLASLRDFGMLTAGELRRLARFAIHLLAFDHERDYARYDGLSLAELAHRVGVSPRAMAHFLRPFAFSFDYAEPEDVSASSILSAMQFYMLPSATALQPRWCRGLEHERIFNPIGRAILAQGGQIATATQLESVEITKGRVTAVTLSRTEIADGDETIADVALADVPEDDYIEVESAAGLIFIGRHAGELRVLSSTCPHMSFRVRRGDGGFECPAHSSTFRDDGSLISGPAKPGLSPARFEVRGERLVVFGATSRTRVTCSDVILATSVHPAARILQASRGVPEPLRADLAALRTTPVIVVRLWLVADAPFPDDQESIVFPNGHFVDVSFHLNALGQSRASHGVVLEVHCACSGRKTRWLQATEQALIDAAFADLAAIAPGLTRAHLHPEHAPEVQIHRDTFTLYAPGDAGRRPGARTGVAGLTLAGDWTHADWSVWMMERAVVSGLRAANVVLEAMGKPAATIERLPREGLLLSLSRQVARLVRRLLPDVTAPQAPAAGADVVTDQDPYTPPRMRSRASSGS